MPDNFYDSGSEDDSQSSPSSAESDESSNPKDKAKDDDSNTALLPKSFFRNNDKLKAGDTEKIEIVHVYEDEVEAKCIYSKDKSKDKSDSNDSDSEDMKESMSQLEDSYA